MNRLIFFSIVLAFCSCSRDTVTEPDCTVIEEQTYQEVKLILNESCAYTGCHLNNGAPGNFDTYDGVKNYLDINNSNIFTSDVNSERMPPDYAEEGKMTISPLEILQLICWIDNGYPEE